MASEKSGLGEQALNKMAKIALSTQLDEAEKLEVQVKVDPSNLAKGEVDSLAIEGEGLVTQQDLRMEELEMQISNIAVNPLSALFGKIELTKTSSGTARVVLTEADIARALNSEAGSPSLHQVDIGLGATSVVFNTQEIECRILPDSQIEINAAFEYRATGETKQVSFTTKPSVSEQGVVLQDVSAAAGEERSQITSAIAACLGEVLNLRSFKMEGISLQVRELNCEAGKITLLAIARITQLPKA